MPVYLFTYHTYGSWLPDRPRGYVRRGEGVLPTDNEMAAQYRQNMTQDEVLLDESQQQATIESLLTTADHTEAEIHAVATEPTHVHVLASWRDERAPEKVSTSLKRGVTLVLQGAYGKQKWLSRDHSRKRVEQHEHFEYLVANYLPKHSGWCWNGTRGFFRNADG